MYDGVFLFGAFAKVAQNIFYVACQKHVYKFFNNPVNAFIKVVAGYVLKHFAQKRVATRYKSGGLFAAKVV